MTAKIQFYNVACSYTTKILYSYVKNICVCILLKIKFTVYTLPYLGFTGSMT